MEFRWYNYGDRGLKDGFDIRLEVFCKEVGFSEDFEFDAGDKEALHLVCYDGGKAVCNARILKEGDNSYHFGRLRCPKEYRGKGYGKATVLQAVEKCRQLKANTITLGAKYDKKGFYEALGFTAYGEIFQEEGIPHINMKTDLTEE